MSWTPPTAHCLLRFVLIATASILSAGCMTDESDQVFVFRAYQLANPNRVGPKLSRQVIDHEGTRVAWVRTIPLITSVNIVDAEALETDGGQAVKMGLDHFGGNVWLQVCKQLGGQDMVVTVDGFYLFRTTIPHRQARYDEMLVEGPWGLAQANGVAAHASENYAIANPEPGL
jgi:hypothetical protein